MVDVSFDAIAYVKANVVMIVFQQLLQNTILNFSGDIIVQLP